MLKVFLSSPTGILTSITIIGAILVVTVCAVVWTMKSAEKL